MNYLWDNIFRRSRKEETLRSALRANVLFQDLSDRELKFIESIVHVRQYHAGEPIFRQGEIGVGMYLIVKGRVEIFVTDKTLPFTTGKASVSGAMTEPREIFITQLTEDDFFGEVSLVEENGRRTASAIARDATEVIGFFKPDLTETLARSPASGIKILFRLAEVLGRRLKETTEKVTDLRGALRELREPPPMEVPNGSKASGQPPA